MSGIKDLSPRDDFFVDMAYRPGEGERVEPVRDLAGMLFIYGGLVEASKRYSRIDQYAGLPPVEIRPYQSGDFTLAEIPPAEQ